MMIDNRVEYDLAGIGNVEGIRHYMNKLAWGWYHDNRNIAIGHIWRFPIKVYHVKRLFTLMFGPDNNG